MASSGARRSMPANVDDDNMDSLVAGSLAGISIIPDVVFVVVNETRHGGVVYIVPVGGLASGCLISVSSEYDVDNDCWDPQVGIAAHPAAQGAFASGPRTLLQSRPLLQFKIGICFREKSIHRRFAEQQMFSGRR